jgi:hypothetical protein
VVLPIIAQPRHVFNAVSFSGRIKKRPHGFWSHSIHLSVTTSCGKHLPHQNGKNTGLQNNELSGMIGAL